MSTLGAFTALALGLTGTPAHGAARVTTNPPGPATAASFAPTPTTNPRTTGTRTTPQTIGACVMAAATAYQLPPVLLIILLNVEGGKPGAVHHNGNGTVDIGPMQVNQIWLPVLAAHWHATEPATYTALRDSFCANVAAGSWILRRSIRDAGGDLWEGVAIYHSRAPNFQSAYLRTVLAEVRHLQATARSADP